MWLNIQPASKPIPVYLNIRLQVLETEFLAEKEALGMQMSVNLSVSLPIRISSLEDFKPFIRLLTLISDSQ